MPDGTLHPLLLDGFSGARLTEALNAYVCRAKAGAQDAALVTGTGKDLLEAVVAHILTERIKGYPANKNFEGLLATVFLQLGLAPPIPDGQPPKGEPVQRQVERAMFNLAVSINRLRNKRKELDTDVHGKPRLLKAKRDLPLKAWAQSRIFCSQGMQVTTENSFC